MRREALLEQIYILLVVSGSCFPAIIYYSVFYSAIPRGKIVFNDDPGPPIITQYLQLIQDGSAVR